MTITLFVFIAVASGGLLWKINALEERLTEVSLARAQETIDLSWAVAAHSKQLGLTHTQMQKLCSDMEDEVTASCPCDKCAANREQLAKARS